MKKGIVKKKTPEPEVVSITKLRENLGGEVQVGNRRFSLKDLTIEMMTKLMDGGRLSEREQRLISPHLVLAEFEAANKIHNVPQTFQDLISKMKLETGSAKYQENISKLKKKLGELTRKTSSARPSLRYRKGSAHKGLNL